MKNLMILLLITFSLMGCCKSSNVGKVYVDKDLLSYIDVGKIGSKWIYESRGVLDTIIYIDKRISTGSYLIEDRSSKLKKCGIYEDHETFSINLFGKINNIVLYSSKEIEINGNMGTRYYSFSDSMYTQFQVFRDSILVVRYKEFEYYFKKNVGLIAYNIDLDTNLYKLKELIL